MSSPCLCLQGLPLLLFLSFFFFFNKSLSLNVQQVPRQHFLLAIGGNRHYDRESRYLSRNGIKDCHCLGYQGQQIFRPISLFHLWPGDFPWQPSPLAPQVSSAPPPVSAWLSYLPHPSPALLLGLLPGLLLATFAAQHSTCCPFPRPFQVELLFLFIYFLFFSFIFISWRLITLQHCSDFVIH